MVCYKDSIRWSVTFDSIPFDGPFDGLSSMVRYKGSILRILLKKKKNGKIQPMSKALCDKNLVFPIPVDIHDWKFYVSPKKYDCVTFVFCANVFLTKCYEK